MEKLLLQFLTTGDFPLGFRMQMEIPEDINNKIKKCSTYIRANGPVDEETAKDFISKL